jgi:hypothetical protein
MSISIGAETDIKTIVAVHSQCPLWVESGQTIAGQNPPLSVVTPIADKRGCGWIVRFVSLATDAPQQTASLFDNFVGTGEQRRRNDETDDLADEESICR